jgi:hypothetical protein
MDKAIPHENWTFLVALVVTDVPEELSVVDFWCKSSRWFEVAEFTESETK